MAVVDLKSNLYRDPNTLGAIPDAARVRGVVRNARGSVSNGSSDSSGSTYLLGKVPSSALVHPDTFFDVENWGFAQVVIGTLSDTDALLDVARSAATTQSPFADGDANHGKAWWDALGMASDPGDEIEIYAHSEAGATGAGTLLFTLAWVDHQ